MMSADKFILWFNEVDKDDIGIVGGKGANLGEMVSFGIPVPPGFIVTARAYFYFLKENDLEEKLRQSLQGIVRSDPESYAKVSSKIKKLILDSMMPKSLGLAIMKAYLKLSGSLTQAFVAVRSSATAEDLPDASFAGQQETFLNVVGEANVVQKVKECFASLFEPRAIFYREEKGFDHLKVGIAVPVQKMIQSQTSGVMFTVDPVTNKKNIIIIEAIYGLGEFIVQGRVTPDRYEIDQKSLKILSKSVSTQPVQLISARGGSASGGKVGSSNKEVPVSKNLRAKQKITNRQIVELARLGKKIHKHYFYPQDIEWAVEGRTIYILQTRPVTTLEEKPLKKREWEVGNEKREVILTGTAASPGIATGPVKIIYSAREINKVEKGEVLVTPMTSPDFVPVMKRAAAIVTDRGGQTSHAAIVSRELGIPCVVGTHQATKLLKNGQVVTVSGSKGEIYKGGILAASQPASPKLHRGEQVSPPASQLPENGIVQLKTATKIYVNLAEPELAAKVACENVDGVGLLRAEFMIAQIGQHPRKIIKERKQKMFTGKLMKNISVFCENFNPRPVVYRTTDFKTNEYRGLIGGQQFETQEANPMLGVRGALRYIIDSEVLEMELEAIKNVRNRLGLKNLWLMVPFVRTPEELGEVKKIIAASGLARSPSFKLWMMVEVPSNVILLEEFIKVGIDGVSIGSNDLTMLLLGVDRDNEKLVGSFNEENPAVLWAIEKVIKTCHKHKITSSICGQAPSTYPRLVEKLVKWGITSISVNPDAIEETTKIVYETEKELIT